MVFFFEPRGYGPGKEDNLVPQVQVYMGRDKHENEDLIRWGLPHDVWLHVDDLSSAHVYLRLPRGRSIDDIPADTLEDCAQLVKANSIAGSKLSSVSVVYTPWGNLKKTGSMETGQVGFHDQRQVRTTVVAKKSNDIVNRLNRTRRESQPDLAAEREAYDREVSAAKKAEVQAQRRAEKAAKEEAARRKEAASYRHLFTDEGSMQSSRDNAAKYATPQDFEDDFM